MKKNKKTSINKRKQKEDKPSGQSNKQQRIEALFGRVLPYLLWDYLEMEGVFKIVPRAVVLTDLSKMGFLKLFSFDPMNLIEIIKILSRLLLIRIVKPSKISPKMKENLREILKKAKMELDRIWPAIKAVGFSGRLGQAEIKWKKAALNRFDDSKRGFKLIKRKYLDDETVYLFREGHEKGDFEGAILKRVIFEEFQESFGKESLRKLMYNENRQKLKFVGKSTN